MRCDVVEWFLAAAVRACDSQFLFSPVPSGWLKWRSMEPEIFTPTPSQPYKYLHVFADLPPAESERGLFHTRPCTQLDSAKMEARLVCAPE